MIQLLFPLGTFNKTIVQLLTRDSSCDKHQFNLTQIQIILFSAHKSDRVSDFVFLEFVITLYYYLSWVKNPGISLLKCQSILIQDPQIIIIIAHITVMETWLTLLDMFPSQLCELQ